MVNTKKWPGGVLIGFGIANVGFAVAGFALQIPVMLSFHSRLVPGPVEPYTALAFFGMSSLNVLFLAILGATGVCLIRRSLRAVAYCNVLFPLEIVYFVAVGMLWLNPAIGISVAAATGIGNMGIVPQILTGYPVIALVALNIARANSERRQDREAV